MPQFLSQVRFSFHAKVLITVISMMALLMAITAWVTNRRIREQFEADAAQQLRAARAVFQNSQKIRLNNLLLRFQYVPSEPRFKAVFQLRDPKTLRFLLNELLPQLGADLALFTAADESTVTSAGRDGQNAAERLEEQARPSIKSALDGNSAVDTAEIAGELYDLATVPVTVGSNVEGALTFAIRLDEKVAGELKQLTRTEVLFVANGQITASTLPNPDTAGLGAHARTLQESSQRDVHQLEVNAEHYLALYGEVPGSRRAHTIGFILLSSYEKSLQALAATQRLLLWVGIAGVAIATLIIWYFVGKITRPLRQLRDSAEAVGCNDFSRKVEITSRDECGELAAVFNRMTDNLKTSREELEKTVETLRTTQAQLVQSEKLSAIGEFVAGVTHELNNPLTSVIGFAELLQKSDVGPQQRRHLQFISNAAGRCHKIVQSLLSFARQQKPEKKLVKIEEVVHAVLEILAYQLRTSNIKVSCAFESDLPLVWADQHQLQQVFLNLINNARQAIEGTSSSGLIQITTAKPAGRITVAIQDSGSGISPENLSKLFTPFFTTKEVGKGTGLGLSLCYGIIQEHGGKIEVHSQPGAGATFTVELPAAPGQPKQNTEPCHETPSAPAHLSALKGKRILAVDDEPGILSLIRDALKPAECALDTAEDGESAWEKLCRQDYDLTVCDWRMPGVGGRELHERLSALDAKAAKRMVFITGDVVNETTRVFFEQHGNLCIPKPFAIDEFRYRVNSAVEKLSSND